MNVHDLAYFTTALSDKIIDMGGEKRPEPGLIVLAMAILEAAETISEAIKTGPKDPVHGIGDDTVQSVASAIENVASQITEVASQITETHGGLGIGEGISEAIDNLSAVIDKVPNMAAAINNLAEAVDGKVR